MKFAIEVFNNDLKISEMTFYPKCCNFSFIYIFSIIDNILDDMLGIRMGPAAFIKKKLRISV